MSSSVYKSMVTSTLWVIALRFSIKAIGLFSTVILARLLSPSDFGIMGMIVISSGLFMAFTNFGVEMLLIRNQSANKDDYDTAWTFNIIQYALIAIFMFGLSPLMANYFREPELLQAIPVYCIGVALTGFGNIGIVDFRKNLEFSKDFKFRIYIRCISFILTIGLAVHLQSYWALIYGYIASTIAEIIVSYVMHSYRPRLCLKKAKEFLHFSIYLSLTNIARFLNESFPRIVVGRLTDTDNFGRFHVAQEVPSVLVGEPVIAASRALWPNYARIKDDVNLFQTSFLNSIGLIMLIGFPASFGLAVISADVVALVFGEKWLNLEDIMKWMSVFAFISYFIQFITSNMLVVEHGERWTLAMGWIRFVVLAISVLTAGYMFGFSAVPPAMVFACFLTLPIVFLTASKCFGIKLLNFYKITWRPLLSSILMYLMIDYLHFEDAYILPLRLCVNIIIGIFVYTVCVALLWKVFGSREGLELAIQEKTKIFFQRH